MRPDERDVSPVTDHGGNLAAARSRFPGATEPLVDLSTGISPFPYPYSPPSATAFSRLPEPAAMKNLMTLAASAYGAPSAGNVVAAPGTQMLLPFVFALQDAGKAAVLGPTYAEHRRVAALIGYRCEDVDSLTGLAEADLAIAVNPNNPDGLMTRRADLLELAEGLAQRGGLLVVDEAFMDVAASLESVAGDVEDLPIVVLRSFGKFYGLAGLRLGFAIASEAAATTLRSRLGPWAVSGPALEIGQQALADGDWRRTTRGQLATEVERLGHLLEWHGLTIIGGTSLFVLARHGDAARLCRVLGHKGILVRPFEHLPDRLRFGLPADESAWGRLDAALALWSATAEG